MVLISPLLPSFIYRCILVLLISVPCWRNAEEGTPNFSKGRLHGMDTPLEVFCCYAREDQDMLTHLKKHLAPLVRQGRIMVWCDTDLSAGVAWERVLHEHLERADIILLLISPDFMNSDYC